MKITRNVFAASFVKTCRRKEPDLAKCLLEQTLESVKPHLAAGWLTTYGYYFDFKFRIVYAHANIYRSRQKRERVRV